MNSKDNPIKVNSIWISDTHLGSKGCQTKNLETFLKSIVCNNLFLNGDIIDKFLIGNIEQLENQYTSIINAIKELTNKGTKIYFLQGNHDQESHVKHIFSDIIYKKEIKYKTIHNKTYLIFHGDTCDISVSLKSKKIAKFGTFFYEFFLSRKKENNNYANISKYIKVISKKILLFIFQYEKQLLRYLKKQNVDGVICGHSHQPIIKKLKTMDYLNSGDWIDNCSYIIETEQGDFKLLQWNTKQDIN